MKKLKSTNGFTLVELIVVIAILAILAGIAVPAYSGYINKANDAKVTTEFAAVHTAAQAALATSSEKLTRIDISKDGKITVNQKADALAIYTEMANLLGDGDTTVASADATGVTYATIKASISDSNTYKTKGAKWTVTDGWTVGGN